MSGNGASMSPAVYKACIAVVASLIVPTNSC